MLDHFDFRSRLRRWPLRVKGRVILALFIAYSVVLGSYVMYQKSVLLKEFAKLEEITSAAGVLERFDADVVLASNVSIADGDPQSTAVEVDEARSGLHTMWNQYADLTAKVPEVPLALRRLDQVLGELAAHPSGALLAKLHAQVMSEHGSLTHLADRLRFRRDALTEEYRQRSDRVARIALLLGLGGIVTFGAVVSVFVTRLTKDVLDARNNAKNIAKRIHQELHPISRYDEVGELMEAINRMSQELDERDKQLEIERQKYFYREKMAAIGDLAIGIAHEITNPISAIGGVAKAMEDAQAADKTPTSEYRSQPTLILAQTARLAAITREIANFATPAPAEHQLLNLNDLIRSTCSFLRFDPRFRRVDLETNLNREIPAVKIVRDRLIQVIMNLLINAVDALEGLQDRIPRISIATSVAENAVCMAVTDNGCGMDENTRRHAFEAFFTTKRPGRGTGLGLALCYSILEEYGGKIEMKSIPNEGTRVRVMLPLQLAAP